ncbi:MAG TPA: class I SAM-dependent methyltransferase [Gaiellaceae bacterium]|nr:class I SAM-dependent methyltransferase [Gaiellaceae bacterium]
MSQFHFDPGTYLENIRADIPVFDELQEATARATEGIEVRDVLDLGIGTGETARRVLARHRGARLVGIDESEAMLAAADLEGDLRVSRLEDPLPDGPFDLVVSCLAIHHLDAGGKRDLFRRIAAVLRPGGRFVLADVVVPEREEDSVTPTTPGFDRPDALEPQLEWLREAGFEPELAWSWKDLAVLRADLAG